MPNHDKHTHDKHFSHNKHTLFSPTKMCLFGKKEDFGKISSLYFFKIESLKTHFLSFFPAISSKISTFSQNKQFSPNKHFENVLIMTVMSLIIYEWVQYCYNFHIFLN